MKKLVLVVIFVFIALQVYAGQYDNATIVSSKPEASSGNFDHSTDSTGDSIGNFDNPSDNLGDSSGNFDNPSDNLGDSSGNFDSPMDNTGDSSGNFDTPEENFGNASENLDDSSAAEELSLKTVPKFIPQTSSK